MQLTICAKADQQAGDCAQAGVSKGLAAWVWCMERWQEESWIVQIDCPLVQLARALGADEEI